MAGEEEEDYIHPPLRLFHLGRAWAQPRTEEGKKEEEEGP